MEIHVSKSRFTAAAGMIALSILVGVAATGAGGEPDAKEIRKFDVGRDVSPAGRYPEPMVVGSFDGSFANALDYRSEDGAFQVALWESGPGALKTESYPHDEFCLVLEGELVVTNAKSGTTVRFGPGDTFVIPKGWAGTWDMKTRFRKQYVAFGEVMPAA